MWVRNWYNSSNERRIDPSSWGASRINIDAPREARAWVSVVCPQSHHQCLRRVIRSERAASGAISEERLLRRPDSLRSLLCPDSQP